MRPSGWPLGSAEPAGFISPHLDDVVLSCGQLLAGRPGSHVITVFSSGPARVDPLPGWDKLCGCFEPGDDIVGIRRSEDEAALDLLHATPHHLDLWPLQYRVARQAGRGRLRSLLTRLPQMPAAASRLEEQVTRQLRDVMSDLRVDTWFIPLGVTHEDHRLTARAALRIAREIPELQWCVYEDLPYASERPADADAARAGIRASGIVLEALTSRLDSGSDSKRAAVACYHSQLAALGERVQAALYGPEVYWSITGNRASVA